MIAALLRLIIVLAACARQSRALRGQGLGTDRRASQVREMQKGQPKDSRTTRVSVYRVCSFLRHMLVLVAQRAGACCISRTTCSRCYGERPAADSSPAYAKKACPFSVINLRSVVFVCERAQWWRFRHLRCTARCRITNAGVCSVVVAVARCMMDTVASAQPRTAFVPPKDALSSWLSAHAYSLLGALTCARGVGVP